MSLSIDDIKRLKTLTGIGLTDAKTALVEADGDFDKALEVLRQKGLTKAEKKSEREARQGIVDSYVHSDRIGVVVEVNCETDFVARTDGFREFVHDIALHIAAMSPEFISDNDIPAEQRAAKLTEFKQRAEAEGKPVEMVSKIAEGMVQKYFAEKILLQQSFIKNPDQTIGDFLKENIAKFGENTVIRQFKRIELGEVN